MKSGNLREHQTIMGITDRELHSITLAGVIARSQAKLRRTGLTNTEYDLMEMAIKEFEQNLDAAETFNCKVTAVAMIESMGGMYT